MNPRRLPLIVAMALALGCSATRAAEHKVASAEEIHTVLKEAKPGDVLVMSDGEWKDQLITFAAKGTKDQPITLRAQTPGAVKLIGNSGINFTGDFCVASGLFFGESDSVEPAIAFIGNDNRVTDSAIISMNRGGKWVHFQSGQRNRFDHCYLEGHKPKEPTLQVEIDEKIPNFAQIDHNHFGPRPPLGQNGGETMRVGYSFQQNRSTKAVVEYNLFDRCDGEIEIISNKSTDSTYRYNTFRHCNGTLTLRHGGRATVDGNFFLGRSDGKSGGIRVIGHGHTIVNNYIENCAPTAGGVIALTSAMRDPKPVDYQHVNGALVAFNTIVNCGLPYVRLDAGFAPERTRDVLPKDVILANNVFLAGKSDAKSEANQNLVHGQEGPGFKWVGNIAFGAEVGDAGTAKGGIKIVDPKLAPGEDKVMRPAADSPVRGAAQGDYKVETDVDAQPRGDKKDVGADQVSDAPAKNKPLNPEDVGPSWRKTAKTASANVTEVLVATYAAQNAPAAATEAQPAAAAAAPVPQPAPLPVERGGREPIYFEKHPDLFVRYERETRSFVMKGPRGWEASSVSLCPEIVNQRTVWAVVVEHEDALGKASAFEVQSEAGEQRFWAYDNLPFLFTRVTLRNTTTEPIEPKNIVPLTVRLKTPSAAGRTQEMRLFGADGPGPAEKGKAGYVFLAAVEAKSNAGMVAGFITHDRGSGIVDAKYNGTISVEGRSEYGRLPLAPGQQEEGETFAIGFFEDARDGLELFADVTAKANDVKLKPVPSGYSTWYHAGALDQDRMAKLAQFVKDQRLTEYGFEFLQIDDKWQIHRRDFTTHKTGEKAPYRDGMKKTADTIKAAGLTAGLWLTPFGWQGQDKQDGKDVPNQTVLKDKPDYFVKRKDGSIYQVRWAGDCLDMSHPEARAFLKQTIQRMTNDWGYKLLKIDGLWAGMAVKILYPSPKYRDDELGDAVFYDKTKTNVEVYRDGLKLVREAAGPDTFLLGCNIAQNMRTMGASIGLVDAMRVGPDIKAAWENVVRCAKPASYMYFWNGKVWHNDPDCLMLRDPLTLEQGRAWGSWIGLSGQMLLVSEWLPDLPPEKFDVLKRAIPNHRNTKARPVDLFDRDLPRVWHVSWGEGDQRRDVVALFNWAAPRPTGKPKSDGASLEEPTTQKANVVYADGPETIRLDLRELGLPTDKVFAAFDYWGNTFIEPFAKSKDFSLPPGTCKVIALAPVVDHPVLIGTNRHVSQGIVDVVTVAWDGSGKTLRGTSKVVGGDPYELRIHTNGAKLSNVSAAGGAGATSEQDGQNARVTITSDTTREVEWEVRFAQ